jgi:hypothetical protein
VETYSDYLRTYAPSLGSRIVEMYPPLQGPLDPIAAPIATLLRKPLPAQALTISGLAKALNTARSVRIVGECGTGKTLMSMGVAHAHANGATYTAIAMCPPHLVLKWAREVLITVPRARAFVIYDMRNGGDPARPHGVVEVQLKNGRAVNKGLKTTLFRAASDSQPLRCSHRGAARRTPGGYGRGESRRRRRDSRRNLGRRS